MALSRFVLPFADVGSGIRPSSGAKLFFLETGTSNQSNTYNCPDGSTANSNPVIADSTGLFPDIFFSGVFKVILQDRNGVQIWEADPVSSQLQIAEVRTIALLKSSEPTVDGQQISLLGHTTAGLGGGVYFYDASDTTSANNDGLVVVTAGGKRWIRKLDNFRSIYSTAWFGDLGDGLDYSAEAQAVIDIIEASGVSGTMFLPFGKRVWTGVRISKFGVSIEGESRFGTTSEIINKNTTDTMLTIELSGSDNTVGQAIYSNLAFKNEAVRSGGLPIILAHKLVKFRFDNCLFRALDTLGTTTVTDMLRLESAFEGVIDTCKWEGIRGYSCWIDSTNAQSDSVVFINPQIKDFGLGIVNAAGVGSGMNNLKILGGKFLGHQGGLYVSDGIDSFAKTTITTATGSGITFDVASSTNFAVGKPVLVNGNSVAFEYAIVTNINVNTITVDRSVSWTVSDSIVHGSIGFVNSEARQTNIESVQFEGIDIGVYINGGSVFTMSDGSVSSCSKGIYVDHPARYLSVARVGASTAGVLSNGVTYKLITTDQIADKFLRISCDSVNAEGSSYFGGSVETLLDDVSGFGPMFIGTSRIEGTVITGVDDYGLTLKSGAYLRQDRASTADITRMAWTTEGGGDQFRMGTTTGATPNLETFVPGKGVSISINNQGDTVIGSSIWNTELFKIGPYAIWVGGGALRIKAGDPTSTSDGTVIVVI